MVWGVVRDALGEQVEDATLTGPARIIDGDTLEVRGTRVRLHGIDAPERTQRCRSAGRVWSCGREATRALAHRIGLRPVACSRLDQDRYGRVVAVVPSRGRRRERVDGRCGLGVRLPQVLPRSAVRCGRNSGESGQTRCMARCGVTWSRPGTGVEASESSAQGGHCA